MASDDQRRAVGSAARECASVPGDLERRFSDRVRIFASRRLGDPSAAEDVTQETLARVIEALDQDRLQDPQALAGFVFQTARHICSHHARRAGRERRALDRFGREPRPAGSSSPLLCLVSRQRRLQVRAALDALSSSDRELLDLFYYQELTTDEIARRLGVQPGAVRVRKHRALRRLGELLSGEPSAERTD